MWLAVTRFLSLISIIFAFGLAAEAQNLTRELNITSGGSVEIINRYGRIGITAAAVVGNKPTAGKLTASSPKGVSDGEIKLSSANGRMVITVAPSDKRKRVDLTLVLPERSNIRVETLAGAVEVVGNFASIEATTDTGTIAVDVPADDLNYHFLWTESRPRYLADFGIAEVKEKTAGRFEVKGRRGGEKAETR